MWRDPATLLDIAKAIRLIQEFKRGVDCEIFMADRKTQAAILYQITILGEAVKRLSTFRAAGRTARRAKCCKQA